MTALLGLQRGKVKLLTHDPQWKESFEKEKKLIQETFKETVLSIEHVGSTAIPGIVAKPIIDINIGVASLEVAKGMKDEFKKIGYTHRPFVAGETKETQRLSELYVRGPEARRTHYAHVSAYKDDYWKSGPLFRDFLISHPEVAKEYDKLKRGLAAKYSDARKLYSKGKEEFIEAVLKRAKKEAA